MSMSSTSPVNKIRVVIAEDNTDLREMLVALIDEEPDMQCVASTESLEALGPLLIEHQAQVVLLDLQLRDGQVMPHLAELCRVHPATGFIVHSGRASAELADQARDAGARGYAIKSGDIGQLLATIRRATA